MKKPISSLFVFSVVYCVAFRQRLKKTRRKHNKKTERNIFLKKRKKKNKKLQEKHKQRIKQNINTGYPALEPTANKYLSGSGWEMSVCSVCVCHVFCFCSVVLCVMFLYGLFSIVNAKA